MGTEQISKVAAGLVVSPYTNAPVYEKLSKEARGRSKAHSRYDCWIEPEHTKRHVRVQSRWLSQQRRVEGLHRELHYDDQ
jgi:hypothetical protein